MPIQLNEARYAYPDGTVAVDGVDLRIEAGERVAIIGQNGAGKTTTVKMMNGLLRPSSGQVEIDGRDTAQHTTAQIARDVGYVFQNPDDQIFGSDVQGELEYLPRSLRWPEQRRIERVTRAAAMTGIGAFLDLNPGDLPFAIKKFVAIGAVLVGECRYLILDEPTAGLDGRGLALLRLLIDQLEAEGVAVITITHDMRFVRDCFTRVVAMAHRQIIADGTVAEVFGDDGVMRDAKLERPEIGELARRLGLADASAGVAELADLLV
ncbi:energy-coupling factor ABC transporter ATP-binding protein [Brachybacterium hainanense]|uniref:Energy-coupling factor ABC transporter ATP-binding protein n=1 Tax=Brachybacterium hainanense TaxID=1541174 RepID=A0ABV6R875_9MICO